MDCIHALLIGGEVNRAMPEYFLESFLMGLKMREPPKTVRFLCGA
ncbi:MAG: hypothetical protein CM15mP74_17130 [Halieaceae bacterium]|nr:MAG: hypothetical protein CM15mP74_17130 [Halieaceae bacterium]